MAGGDKIGATYTASWEDAKTGKQMQGRGTEFWQRMRDGKLVLVGGCAQPLGSRDRQFGDVLIG